MTTYAVAHLRNVRMSPEIIEYLKSIDDTLALFNGRSIIHGGVKQELEGHFADDLIVLALPDRRSANDWYRSDAYQAILAKRLSTSEGEIFLIDGVDKTHRATDILAREPGAVA